MMGTMAATDELCIRVISKYDLPAVVELEKKEKSFKDENLVKCGWDIPICDESVWTEQDFGKVLSTGTGKGLVIEKVGKIKNIQGFIIYQLMPRQYAILNTVIANKNSILFKKLVQNLIDRATYEDFLIDKITVDLTDKDFDNKFQINETEKSVSIMKLYSELKFDGKSLDKQGNIRYTYLVQR